jgi:hypothetical protein
MSNFLKKLLQWEQSCSMRTDRRIDRHDEANSRFSQFCERDKKSIKLCEYNDEKLLWIGVELTFKLGCLIQLDHKLAGTNTGFLLEISLVSATGPSLAEGHPTVCGVSFCHAKISL